MKLDRDCRRTLRHRLPPRRLRRRATARRAAEAGGGDEATYVDGGTFTMALASDPGNLDPQMAAGSALFTISQLAYDSLVSVNAETGAIESQLATDWTVDGTTVTLHPRRRRDLRRRQRAARATVVADNIAFVGDPKNQSPFLGTFLPVGATAKADDAAGTVTLKLAAPAPFVLNGLASLPIVCHGGHGRPQVAGAGHGGHRPVRAHRGRARRAVHLPDPRRLHLGPERRDHRDRGHAGHDRDEDRRRTRRPRRTCCCPATSTPRRSSARTPSAWTQAGLFSAETPALLGEQWYNHAEGRATSDPDVRMALTQALDLAELQNVLTSGKGTPATTLTTLEPTACPGDSVSGSVPATDTEAAKAVLDEAGPLELTFLYSTGGGSGVAAAAELAVQQWEAARHQGDGQGRRTTPRSRGPSSAPVTGTSPGSRST